MRGGSRYFGYPHLKLDAHVGALRIWRPAIFAGEDSGVFIRVFIRVFSKLTVWHATSRI